MKLVRQKSFLPYVRVGLFGYWLALVVGTHLPGHAISPSFSQHDKALHATAYFVFAALSFLWLSLEGWSIQRSIITLLPALSLQGALDELTQLTIPGRFGDVRDWAADTAGAATG